MHRRMLAAVLLAGLSFPIAAGAQFAFGVSAGVLTPLGTFANGVNSGYQITGIQEYSVPLAPFGFRGEASWSQNGYKGATNGAKARILSLTGNGIFSPPGMGGAYLIAGWGLYYMTAECTGCTTSATKGGINGGIGYRMGLAGLSTFIEARYHYIAGPSDPTNAGVPGSTTRFLPVTVGIKF